MAILQKKKELTQEELQKLHYIRPGTHLDLQVNAPTGGKRAKTEFVGIDGNKYLIFKFPDEAKWGQLRDGIYEGNTIVVRCILEDNGGEVVAFKSRVAGISSHPSKLVFIDFPDNLQRRQLRTQPRINTLIPVAITFPDRPQALSVAEFEQSILVDISLGGGRIAARLKSGQMELKDDKVFLDLHGNQGESFHIHGHVVNQKADNHMLYLGITFDEAKDVIEQLFSGLLIDVNLLKEE